MQIVVMGVSGTGKTSVGRRLAEQLAAPFEEGDAHHPPGNIEKMAAGIPLTDQDRRPWLEELADVLARAYRSGRRSVLTCSALKRGYRDLLRSKVPAGSVVFVHLHSDLATLTRRMAQRPGHFMPPSLLRSQLDDLEPLEPDERGFVLDVAGPLEEVVTQALRRLRDLAGEPSDDPTGDPSVDRTADMGGDDPS